MDILSTGALIKSLRVERGLTQAELANQLNVSDKTISKWERDSGLPDIGFLTDISKVFGVNIERILSGELSANDTDGGNMKQVSFYLCPNCGAILTSTSQADISCCGRKLVALQAEHMDEEHHLSINCSDHDCYISFSHAMDKDHYIGFIARVTFDTVLVKRLYPEQGSEVYLPPMRGGKIFCYCSRHGLMAADFCAETTNIVPNEFDTGETDMGSKPATSK